MRKNDHFPIGLFNRVKEHRVNRGLSQIVLAEKINITRVALSRIEHGQVIPSVLTALRIAEYLEVNVEDLFTFEKKEKNRYLIEAEEREKYLKEVLIRNGIYKEEDFTN